MIIMQIIICLIIMQIIICLIIMQITIWTQLSSSKVILMHNTVVYMYLHSYKINILICNSKYTEYQKKP